MITSFCLSKNQDSIIKNGLLILTQTKRSYHPPRIYVCDESQSDVLATKFAEDHNMNVIIFDVYTKNLTNLWYKDPFMIDGWYTYEPISPKNIGDIHGFTWRDEENLYD
jgi:hypothetical protein